MQYYDQKGLRLFLNYFNTNILDEFNFEKLNILVKENRPKNKVEVHKILYIVYLVYNLKKRNINFSYNYNNFSSFTINIKDNNSKNVLQIKAYEKRNLDKSEIILQDCFEFLKNPILNINNHNKILSILEENSNIHESDINHYLYQYNKSMLDCKITPQLAGIIYEVLVVQELSKHLTINVKGSKDTCQPDASAIVKKIKINFEISTCKHSKRKNKQFSKWIKNGKIGVNDLNIFIGKILSKYDYSFDLSFDSHFSIIKNQYFKDLILLINNIKLQSIHMREKYIK